MEKYLEGTKLTPQEIAAGLKAAVTGGTLVPVFAGSAVKDIGITELMDAVSAIMPDALSGKEIIHADNSKTAITDSGSGIGIVFKTIIDPFIGQLTILRVLSGVFTSEKEICNLSRDNKERIGQLLVMNGKEQRSVPDAGPGCFIAIAKLKDTHICNTVATVPNLKPLPRIQFPNPVMSYAISAVKSGEEDKIASALHKIIETDPTASLKRHDQTHETLLSGMGDQHLGNIVRKLKDVYKVDVNLATPKIPYRETIMAAGEGHYRHKKQSGGHGQFGEVFIRMSFNEAGYEFVNDVVGGSIPKNFIPAVEKGIVEAMTTGPLAGCIVEKIRVSVYDGKFHAVDSSEMAFKIAARMAFRDAMSKAKPVLLEPIMHVKITIPDHYMGDITGDLNHKRGRILGMDAAGGMQTVNAEIPLAEMSKYATELRSMTQGRGSFETEFSRYEQVPSSVANEIIAKYQAEKQHHEEE
jgi:elongation factor G